MFHRLLKFNQRGIHSTPSFGDLFQRFEFQETSD